jgi:hypothetical protein
VCSCKSPELGRIPKKIYLFTRTDSRHLLLINAEDTGQCTYLRNLTKKNTAPSAWSATHCFLFLQNSPLMNPANFGSFGSSFLTHGAGGAVGLLVFFPHNTALPRLPTPPKRLGLPFPPQNQTYTNGRGMNCGDTVYKWVTHCFPFLENIGLQTPNLDPSYTYPHSLRGCRICVCKNG